MLRTAPRTAGAVPVLPGTLGQQIGFQFQLPDHFLVIFFRRSLFLRPAFFGQYCFSLCLLASLDAFFHRMYKKVHVTHSVSSHIVYNHHHCIAKYLVVSVYPVQFCGARKTQACLLNRSDKPVLFTYDMPNQLQVNTRKRRRITADDLLDA